MVAILEILGIGALGISGLWVLFCAIAHGYRLRNWRRSQR